MQTVFPTLYSTLAPEALATFIGRRYRLPEVSCQFLVRGVGDTYNVHTRNARYILRIYRPTHRTLDEIKAEVALLLKLKEGDIPVSFPVPDNDGNYIQELPAAEGTRHAVLFSFAGGRSPVILTASQLLVLGEQMARFHNLSATLQLPYARWNINLQTTLQVPLERVGSYFSEDQAGLTWLKGAAAAAKDRLAGLDLPQGYCHFDFLPKNFHFDASGNVTFFDFDFFGKGWLVQDIMTFRQQLLLDRWVGRLSEDQFKAAYNAFLQAYTGIRPLSGAELKAIPWLGLGFWVYYMGFHAIHDQFFPLMQPHNLQSRTAMIRRIVEMDREGAL